MLTLTAWCGLVTYWLFPRRHWQRFFPREYIIKDVSKKILPLISVGTSYYDDRDCINVKTLTLKKKIICLRPNRISQNPFKYHGQSTGDVNSSTRQYKYQKLTYAAMKSKKTWQQDTCSRATFILCLRSIILSFTHTQVKWGWQHH